MFDACCFATIFEWIFLGVLYGIKLFKNNNNKIIVVSKIISKVKLNAGNGNAGI